MVEGRAGLFNASVPVVLELQARPTPVAPLWRGRDPSRSASTRRPAFPRQPAAQIETAGANLIRANGLIAQRFSAGPFSRVANEVADLILDGQKNTGRYSMKQTSLTVPR